MIKSIDYLGIERVLVDSETKKPISAGSIVMGFRGDRLKVIDGRAPHNCNSSGKVRVCELPRLGTREFYPIVIGAEWL